MLAVVLPALMGLALLPAAAGAAVPKTPTWVSVGSGDGTMELVWSAASDATGYQYRYTNSATGFLEFVPCADDCIRSEWLEASTNKSDIDKTIDPATNSGDPVLTVGTTYLLPGACG